MVFGVRSTLVAVLVSSAVAAWSGWMINGWRLGNATEAQKAEAATQLAAAGERVRQAEKEYGRLKTEAEIEHAKARQGVERALADNRRLARELGGLRDPGRRPGCPGPVPGTPGDAGQPPAAAAGGELSAEATEFLLEFAAEADRAAEYARACHAWAMTPRR